MITKKIFQEKGYVHLHDFLPKNTCQELTNELKNLIQSNLTVKDPQCPKSQAIHGAESFDKLLEYCLPYFQEVSGLELFPTYSYARLYAPEEELVIHTDREACEISATITLGFEDDCWPIFMGDSMEKDNASEILMQVGDAVLYKGMEKYHWRDKFKGKWQAQVFLHYVDKNGPHAEWKYDKRKRLGLSQNYQQENQLHQFYIAHEAISHGFCDNIIKQYSPAEVTKDAPYIGNGDINLDIRNVQRLPLPMNVGIGGTLTSIGLNLNNDTWKFAITHSNQTEFLMYDVNGKYEEHIDTEIKHSKETRKITVLAILNDDFEGGKFFIKNGHDKIYPQQNKGDVIIFPSFLSHGVEPVTNGIRYTVVTWLVGEFFK